MDHKNDYFLIDNITEYEINIYRPILTSCYDNLVSAQKTNIY